MDDPRDDLTFGSSVLSSKEHWDNEYMREMENYKSFGDIGEIW
jgi:hydroxyacyl-ACP dehydratase HTD2-like protein with hotdog domain